MRHRRDAAERSHGIGGDDGGQRLIADAHADLCEQAVDAHFIDETVQAVPRAQAFQGIIDINDAAATSSLRLLTASKRSISLSEIRWCLP